MSAAMAASLNRQLKSARQHLNMLSQSPALKSPTGYLEQRKKNVEMLKNRLVSAQNQNIHRSKQRYVGLVAKLDAMSPLKVLTRGYSMAQKDGQLIRSIHQVETGDTITISFSDGHLTAAVQDKEESK